MKELEASFDGLSDYDWDYSLNGSRYCIRRKFKHKYIAFTPQRSVDDLYNAALMSRAPRLYNMVLKLLKEIRCHEYCSCYIRDYIGCNCGRGILKSRAINLIIECGVV